MELKRIIQVLVFVIIVLLILYTHTVRELNSLESGINFQIQNSAEVLSTYEMDSVHDVGQVFYIVARLDMLNSYIDESKDVSVNTFFRSALGKYANVFLEYTRSSIDLNQSRFDEISKDLFNLRSIISWYFDMNEYSDVNMSVQELVEKLDLQDDFFEKLGNWHSN